VYTVLLERIVNRTPRLEVLLEALELMELIIHDIFWAHKDDI